MTTALSAHPRIFSDRYLDKKMGSFSLLHIPDFEKKLARIKEWQAGIASQRVIKAKEEQLQDDFLKLFFGDVLDYAYHQDLQTWQLEREYKTVVDGSKADGALGYFQLDPAKKGRVSGDCRAVIELKDARSDLDKPQNRLQDRRTPVQQAFDYASAVGGQCRWVIVSNFLEIRLYHQSDRSRYERFEIKKLTDEAVLRRFFFLLQAQNLLQLSGESRLEALYRQRQSEEAQISTQFYQEYKQARSDLFAHLCQQNPQTDPLFLLTKTQKLLDRLTFIWFCEDFQIVPPYTLRRLLEAVRQDAFNRSDTKIWDRIRNLFEAVDKGYPEAGINAFNGGLFAPDAELDALQIKDSVLAEIIALEKYDFASDLDVNILGHIFEQSISDLEALRAQILNQTYDAGQGKRKKDGIFYTPQTITRYLVEQSVGGWLQRRREALGEAQLPELQPADYESIQLQKGKLKANKAVLKHIAFWEQYREVLAQIRVLDPACGSGAFLNQVFDYLYAEGQSVNEHLAQLKLGQRELFDLDRQILSQNLFGVDLNPESVALNRLSLWLKTASNHKSLTSLDKNIRVGNSLISDPAFAGAQAFDWQTAFAEIMAEGGFDVVVGNPPYVRQELFSAAKPYLEAHYAVYHGMADLYVYFFERGLTLLKPGGQFGFIVSNKFLRAGYGRSLTHWLQSHYTVQEVIDFGDLQIFEGATTYPCIITLSNTAPAAQQTVRTLLLPDLAAVQQLDQAMARSGSTLQLSPDSTAWLIADSDVQGLLSKAQQGAVPLGEWNQNQIYYGIKTGFNDAFVIDGATRQALIAQDPRSAELIKPYLVGRQLSRYGFEPQDKWLIFTRRGIDIDAYPAIKAHLSQWRERLEPGTGRKAGTYKWFEIQDNVAYYPVFEQPKIIYSEIASRGQFFLDTEGFYCDTTVYMLASDSAYLLAVFNSRLFSFLFAQVSSEIRGGFLRWKKQYMKDMPIQIPTPEQEAALGQLALENQALHQRQHQVRTRALAFMQQELSLAKITQKLNRLELLSWADFAAELRKQKIALSLSQKEEWQDWHQQKQQTLLALQQEITALDARIDAQVYALYGLNEAEIKQIEEIK
ncbi:MAG: Eco57I restriction-modification methylase domain-containing protein [Candidatus Sericytochromatia bacterium]|nr:Eco57I restriction-modification methylase domain-containing protein [Candidatus Sericytochromatia bacterium]